MPLQKINFKPGVNRENTRYTQEGAWWDMNWVRFRSGTPEKIGGWVGLSADIFLGIARLLHNWVTLAGENLLAVGTNLKLYIERGGNYYDITPIRVTFNPMGADPFTTGSAGSSTVTVTMAAHGAVLGDFVTFSGATTVDGILDTTLNAEFQITSIINSSSFTIEATPCTTGGISGGGAVVVAEFQVNVGEEITVPGVGWGADPWSSGGWGEAASGVGVGAINLRQWIGYNFGQDFVCAIRDGGIYYWTAPTGVVTIDTALATRAIALADMPGSSDAPTIADNILVTDDEHVIVLGTNAIGSSTEDPLLVRWCAQGDPLTWTPLVTNTAGDQRLTAGSYGFAMKKTRQENLLWTDTALISMQFVGPPVVFSFTTLANNISIASATAVVIVDNTAYWMGKDKFFVYNGTVQTLPCAVRKYVFSDFNIEQSGQVFAGQNAAFNEATWWYCSANSTSPDKYVTFNYIESIWTFGSLVRTAWLDSPLRDTPMAAYTDGKIYYHEVGFDDGSTTPVTAISSFLESADFDIGDGERFSFVQRIIPDIDFDGSTAAKPTVTLTLKGRDTPGSNFDQTVSKAVSQTATIPFSQFTNHCWTRIRGRSMVFRVESSDTGVSWQLGTPRIDIREDGGR